MDELLLPPVTGPSLHFKQTGSFLLFALLSPSLHFRLTGSLFLTTLPDNLSPLTHVAEFYSTTHTNEQSPTIPKDKLYSPPTIDDLSHKQGAQLKNQINTHKPVDEGHRPNPMSSTYSNHLVWEPDQFKHNKRAKFQRHGINC